MWTQSVPRALELDTDGSRRCVDEGWFVLALMPTDYEWFKAASGPFPRSPRFPWGNELAERVDTAISLLRP